MGVVTTELKNEILEHFSAIKLKNMIIMLKINAEIFAKFIENKDIKTVIYPTKDIPAKTGATSILEIKKTSETLLYVYARTGSIMIFAAILTVINVYVLFINFFKILCLHT